MRGDTNFSIGDILLDSSSRCVISRIHESPEKVWFTMKWIKFLVLVTTLGLAQEKD